MNGELDYITVKGFRSIKCIDKLSLRAINVLVGANGSGKSNFVGVFSLLHALRHGKLVEYTDKRGGADNILHFGAKETREMELEVSFSNDVNGYRVLLSPTDEDRFRVHDEVGWYWDKERYPTGPYRFGLQGNQGEAGISIPMSRSAGWVQQRLDSWRTYHFHDTSDSSPVKKTADVDDNRYFRADGSNLAPFLYFLQQDDQESYQVIRKTIQRVTPFFDDFQLAPLRRNEDKIKLEWSHKSSDRYFDASALSDGTLRFMCLATLFLQPVEFRPSVILVDEPELGLHPFAISMLATMIKAAAAATQVIVSTQSPLLLDHFEPEDVLVADRENGATTIRRLESAALAEWLDDYSLGQLWEKNQFGGRPARG